MKDDSITWAHVNSESCLHAFISNTCSRSSTLMVLSLNLYVLNRQPLLTLYNWLWGCANVWNRWYVFARISENIPTNNIRRLLMRSVLCEKKTVIKNKLLLGKRSQLLFICNFHDQLHLWLVETSYQKFPARWFSVSISNSIMANPIFLVLSHQTDSGQLKGC